MEEVLIRQIRPTASCVPGGGGRAGLLGRLDCSYGAESRGGAPDGALLVDTFASLVILLIPDFARTPVNLRTCGVPGGRAHEGAARNSANRLTLEADTDDRNAWTIKQLRIACENGLRIFFRRVDFPESQRRPSRTTASPASKI